MSDRATQSLNHILQSGEYVCVPGVVCFDEHDEHDKDGKLLRRFDRSRLQKIADACNKREQTTGDLSLGGPGHTKDDVKTEEDQPPVWFYARNYRLGHFGPKQKLGLLCDYYVRKEITTNEGRKVDGVEYLKTFPQRSVELWPQSNQISWQAVLRRAPERDLGLLTYAREHGDASITFTYSPNHQVIGAMTSKGKLRYSMESPMPDVNTPVEDPNADVSADLPQDDDMPPEGHEDFARHLDYAMKHHPCLKYMADQHASTMDAGAEPAAEPTAPEPAADDAGAAEETEAIDDAEGGEEDEPVIKQQKGGKAGDVTVSRYQRQIDETKAEVAMLKHEKRMLKYEKALTDVRDTEGIQVDVAYELENNVGALDDKGFDKHLDHIRKNYQRTPVGGDLPPDVFAADPKDGDLNDPKIMDKVLKYMRANNIVGPNAPYRAAKEMKLIK